MASQSRIARSPLLQWVLLHLFPVLQQWPVSQWRQILDKARHVEFDRLEQFATLVAVILIAWQIRPTASLGADDLLGYLMQFAHLLPILALILVPFFVRRIRRGLCQVAREQAQSEKQAGAQDSSLTLH